LGKEDGPYSIDSNRETGFKHKGVL
jgi:hypothetical protein